MPTHISTCLLRSSSMKLVQQKLPTNIRILTRVRGFEKISVLPNYMPCLLVVLSFLTSTKQNTRILDVVQLERVATMCGNNIVSPPLS